MDLYTSRHVCKASRAGSVTYLLFGCVTLAENLLATRINRTVSRFVPQLKKSTRLHISPITIGIVVSLARRRTLHVTVRVACSYSLK